MGIKISSIMAALLMSYLAFLISGAVIYCMISFCAGIYYNIQHDKPFFRNVADILNGIPIAMAMLAFYMTKIFFITFCALQAALLLLRKRSYISHLMAGAVICLAVIAANALSFDPYQTIITLNNDVSLALKYTIEWWWLTIPVVIITTSVLWYAQYGEHESKA